MTSENASETSQTSDPDAPLRDRLADAMASEAVFDGWTRSALSTAARQIDLPPGEADRLFPGGPVQVLTHLSQRADLRTVADMEKEGVAGLKMRDRIKGAVRIRLTLAGVYSSTLLYWLNDRSPGSEATWGFLDRRIDDVMRIEKLKSQVRSWTGGSTRTAARR
jgi:ubiquinone biosynthesis protein COQ9